MPRAPLRSPPYKELTLQQLRSFSETARLGSYLAAARSLGIGRRTLYAKMDKLGITATWRIAS